jgi:hypothetical protein
MLSPFGNGHHLGTTRDVGRNRETGPSRGYLAPAGGARCRPGQATGQRMRRGRAGSLHLIHGGALPDSVRQERLSPGPARLVTARTLAVMIWVKAEHRRGPRAAAPRRQAGSTEAVRAQAALPSRPGWRRMRGRPVFQAASSGGRLRRRSGLGPDQILAVGVLAEHASASAVFRCCLPAGKRTALLRGVRKHVDDLCATASGLWARGGNAGDSAARPRPDRALYLGERQPHPVHAEKTGIVHMPRRNGE